MALVRFYYDLGENSYSCRLDTEKHLGLGSGEWEGMCEHDRLKHVEDWAKALIEWGYEEIYSPPKEAICPTQV
jgi:hypothetical protein